MNYQLFCALGIVIVDDDDDATVHITQANCSAPDVARSAHGQTSADVCFLSRGETDPQTPGRRPGQHRPQRHPIRMSEAPEPRLAF